MNEKHPFQIATRFNPDMQRWDLQVLIGNFSSERDAKEAAKALNEWLVNRPNERQRKVGKEE